MTDPAFPAFEGASRAAAEAPLKFGRFQVLLRQRLLLSDGAPIELGTRAFELLLALLEANGSLVSKEQLLARVWPGLAVGEDNLKMQVFKLRRALGEDCEYIRTEFGRGYRFIAAVRSTVPRDSHQCLMRLPYRATKGSFRRPSHGWSLDCLGGHVDPARGAGAARRRGDRRLV